MHRHEEIDESLLARYLAGECPAEQRALVQQWLDAEPGRRAEVAAMQRVWETAAALPASSRVDGMWNDLAARMHTAAPSTIPLSATTIERAQVDRVHRRRSGFRRIMVSLLVLGAAAAAVIAVVVLPLPRPRAAQQGATSNAEVPREFATGRGQRATVRLVDGTRVELGFASTLRISSFNRNRRELFLDGQAVFDVVHDAKRPFVVHAANTTTEDLGTVFQISAYPRGDDVQVVVVSGKVAVRSQTAGDTTQRRIVIVAGQLARVDAAGQLRLVTRADTGVLLAWLGGRLSYRDAPVGVVVADLERRFDVTIRVPDSTVARRRVTIEMSARGIDEVLDAVTVPLGLHHRRADGVIFVER